LALAMTKKVDLESPINKKKTNSSKTNANALTSCFIAWVKMEPFSIQKLIRSTIIAF